MTIEDKRKMKIELENINLNYCSDIEQIKKEIEYADEDFNNYRKNSDKNSIGETYKMIKVLKKLKHKLNSLKETSDEIDVTLKLIERSICNQPSFIPEECI